MARNREKIVEEGEETPEEKRQAKIDRGKLELALAGIDLKEQEKYFESMKENDMPIGNGLLVIELAKSGAEKDRGDLIEGVIKEWQGISDKYQNIDIEKQDENTGREIIVNMKKLIVKLLEQLQVWQKNPQESPKELENIVNEVKICSKDYVKLPAYIAYRAVGMYEFNSDRLHKKISN